MDDAVIEIDDQSAVLYRGTMEFRQRNRFSIKKRKKKVTFKEMHEKRPISLEGELSDINTIYKQKLLNPHLAEKANKFSLAAMKKMAQSMIHFKNSVQTLKLKFDIESFDMWPVIEIEKVLTFQNYPTSLALEI